MKCVYLGLGVAWVVYALKAMPRKIERQERFVAQLEQAYDDYPTKEYWERLQAARKRLKQMMAASCADTV